MSESKHNKQIEKMAMALAISQGFTVELDHRGGWKVLMDTANSRVPVDPEQFLRPARDTYAMLNAIGILHLDEEELEKLESEGDL